MARGSSRISVGRPAPGVELVIHEPDAEGVGEVWARCPHSFLVDDEGWQHEEQPRGLDRPSPEMAEIGVERFRAGNGKKYRT